MNKRKYEEAELEVILLGPSDIITSSGAFDGEEDRIDGWG